MVENEVVGDMDEDIVVIVGRVATGTAIGEENVDTGIVPTDG